MTSMEAVIVLNAGYEFMGLVSWQRAMVLLFNGKVEVVKESDRIVNTVSRTFRIPAVIRLIKFIRQIYRREVPFSRKNILTRDSYECQYLRTGILVRRSDYRSRYTEGPGRFQRMDKCGRLLPYLQYKEGGTNSSSGRDATCTQAF